MPDANDISDTHKLKEGIRCLDAEIRRLERFRASEIALGREAEADAYMVRIVGLYHCRGMLQEALDG